MIDLSQVNVLLDADPVLSLYADCTQESWQAMLTDRLGHTATLISLGQYSAWEALRIRAEEALSRVPDDARGLAAFFSSGGDLVYHLPMPPTVQRVDFGVPMLAPLIWLDDEYQRYLITLLDVEEVHFLTTYLGAIGSEEAMTSDRFVFDRRETRTVSTIREDSSPPVASSGGSASVVGRFQRDVAARINTLMQVYHAERVIIVGDSKSAQALRDLLSGLARDGLVRMIPMPFNSSDEDILAAALPHALDYERAREAETCAQLIKQAKFSRLGVLGWQDVQAVLEDRVVELVVAVWDENDLARLNALSIKAIRRGVTVELVLGAAAEMLAEYGGIGARIRLDAR